MEKSDTKANRYKPTAAEKKLLEGLQKRINTEE